MQNLLCLHMSTFYLLVEIFISFLLHFIIFYLHLCIDTSYKMEITDKDILDSLKAKKEKLLTELHKVNVAICVYEGVEIEGGSKVVIEGDIPVSSNAIKVDAKPLNYEPGLTYSGKILFVLKKNGPSYVTDIVEELLKLEPGAFEREQLSKRITIMTSRLYTTKKITAKKVGRKNKYMLLT